MKESLDKNAHFKVYSSSQKGHLLSVVSTSTDAYLRRYLPIYTWQTHKCMQIGNSKTKRPLRIVHNKS